MCRFESCSFKIPNNDLKKKKKKKKKKPKPCRLPQIVAPGEALNFFQVGVCGPDFRSVGLQTDICLSLKRGACERKISKFAGLWAENFQIWGLVSWKFPNLGACELKFEWKLRLLRLKFLKRGSCELWTDSFAWNGTLASGRRGVKRGSSPGSSGLHIPYSLSRSVPRPGSGTSATSHLSQCHLKGIQKQRN